MLSEVAKNLTNSSNKGTHSVFFMIQPLCVSNKVTPKFPFLIDQVHVLKIAEPVNWHEVNELNKCTLSGEGEVKISCTAN